MQPDYKKALDWFNSANWDERVPEIHVIRHALRIADALQGEPSEGMLNAVQVGTLAEDAFKAMAQQLAKEVEGKDAQG